MYAKTPANRLRHRLIVTALTVASTLAAADDAPTMPDAVPPFILEGVAPNLIITLDNSVSMRQASSFEVDISGLVFDPWHKKRYLSSPEFNTLYYNPATEYVPALDARGNSLGNADFFAAQEEPYLSYHCPLVNLQDGYQILAYETYERDHCGEFNGNFVWQNMGFDAETGPARYHRYDPKIAGCRPQPTDYQIPTSNTEDTAPPDECFREIVVGSAAEQADWALHAPGRPYSVEAARINFANWFQYYRTRALTLKTVMTRVLPDLSPQVRVTWQTLNLPGGFESNPPSPQMRVLQDRFASYSQQTRQALYDWIVSLEMDTMTPLISAHVRAGEFVKTEIAQADNIAVHRAEPSSFGRNSCGVKCRQNFHLLFTDGAWNDIWETAGAPSQPPCTPGDDCLLGAKANQDGSGHMLPINPFGVTEFIPAQSKTSRLFSDSNIGMLADAAFYYWRRDLWPEAENRVPARMSVLQPNTTPTDPANFWDPRNDPASWQHLVLYPIGIAAIGQVRICETCKDATGRAFDGEYLEGGVAKRLSETGFPGQYTALGDSPNGSYGSNARNIPIPVKFDDLLHAAFNSRGQYFEASDPKTLLKSFRQVLLTVSAAAGTSAHGGLALSSGVLNTDTRVYQVLLNPRNWSGEVQAFTVSPGTATEGPCVGKPRGQICESLDNPRWRASAQLPTANARIILTRGQAGPMAFQPTQFDNLSEAQQRGLAGCEATDPCSLADENTVQQAKDRVSWLRGDQSREGTGTGGFRVRESLLGDILSSNLVSVGPPDWLYLDSDYVQFRNNYRERAEILYVGANDGMLHGFDGRTGVERLAYVPEAIYPFLHTLTRPGYGADPAKRAFVDGRLTVADAKIGTGTGADAWRTVLVGTFGVGAQGAYALDITNPADFAENTASRVVLWEFTDRSGSDTDNGALDGRDMGFSAAEPAVVPLKSVQNASSTTRWVVLLSNGYSNDNAVGEAQAHCTDAETDDTNCTLSQTGDAVLYVLDLQGADGAAGAPANRILAKLDTGQGKAQDPAGLARANGLAQVLPVDNDGDLLVDVAYAGDLFGNLWRFDLTNLASPRPPRLLFKAKYPHNDAVAVGDLAQPITAPLAVVRHPTGLGNLVYFGTGRLLNTQDKIDHSIQTFYAIWDAPGRDYQPSDPPDAAPVVSQSQLLRQEFTAHAVAEPAQGQNAARARVSSQNPINWIDHRGWYIDLVTPGTQAQGAAQAEGERVVTEPVVRDGRVLFASSIPADCCDAGGQSWWTLLDAYSGQRLAASGIDFNRDGILNVGDLVRVTGSNDQRVVGSSIALPGVAPSPVQLAVAPGSVSLWRIDEQGKPVSEGFSELSSMRNWVQLR